MDPLSHGSFSWIPLTQIPLTRILFHRDLSHRNPLHMDPFSQESLSHRSLTRIPHTQIPLTQIPLTQILFHRDPSHIDPSHGSLSHRSLTRIPLTQIPLPQVLPIPGSVSGPHEQAGGAAAPGVWAARGSCRVGEACTGGLGPSAAQVGSGTPGMGCGDQRDEQVTCQETNQGLPSQGSQPSLPHHPTLLPKVE